MRAEYTEGIVGKVYFRFKVPDFMKNHLGTAFAGAICSLIDVVNPAGFYGFDSRPGVSVGLDVKFVSAVRLGSVIIAEVKLLKTGKKMAYIETNLYDSETGDLLVSSMHVISFINPASPKL